VMRQHPLRKIAAEVLAACSASAASSRPDNARSAATAKTVA
jgi:hypothetical protein